MDQGIANSGGTVLNMVSRNNIFHINNVWHDSVCDDCTDASNDFDYDLYNGDMPQTSQANGIDDVPVYDPENAHGEFALDPSSPGFDAGVRLAGFNDGFVGVAPDMGAYEAGASGAIFSDSFTVYKDFSDNSSSSVSISLSCTSGTITNNPQNASEASPAVFNILDAAPGAVCQAIENPVPPGYTKDEWDCQQGYPLNDWCVIVNNANTANFLVGISYSDNSDALAKVELQCTNGNVNATHLYASPGNPAVFEVTGFSGDPDCASTEEVPDGYVADQSNCQGVPLLAVGECSMVNVAADQGSDPLANFSFACTYLVCNFADASTDSDGTIASRAWNFRDGSSSTLKDPQHTFAAAGTYNVVLTVTDNDGATHARTRTVTVAAEPPPPVDNPPTVSITSPANGATVSGIVTIIADAKDVEGVVSVKFYIDNDIVKTDTTAPYSYSWDTTQAANASTDLRVVATDTAQKTAQAKISVTVNNVPFKCRLHALNKCNFCRCQAA